MKNYIMAQLFYPWSQQRKYDHPDIQVGRSVVSGLKFAIVLIICGIVVWGLV